MRRSKRAATQISSSAKKKKKKVTSRARGRDWAWRFIKYDGVDTKLNSLYFFQHKLKGDEKRLNRFLFHARKYSCTYNHIFILIYYIAVILQVLIMIFYECVSFIHVIKAFMTKSIDQKLKSQNCIHPKRQWLALRMLCSKLYTF